MPRILPLFSKQLHNLFQHVHWFAIVAPHISAAYRGCSSIFSTSRIGVHQFFSSVLCLINFHHCVFVFFHFLCSSIFILFITCFLFGIVFTWSLLWYIVSSILIICNCFIFRFHHISYIYIYVYIYIYEILLPLPKYFVSKRSENSLKKIIKPAMQNPYISFYTANAILQKKNWTIHAKNCMYAMHTVCFFLCLTLPRNNTAPCHKRGLMGRFI